MMVVYRYKSFEPMTSCCGNLCFLYLAIVLETKEIQLSLLQVSTPTHLRSIKYKTNTRSCVVPRRNICTQLF